MTNMMQLQVIYIYNSIVLNVEQPITNADRAVFHFSQIIIVDGQNVQYCANFYYTIIIYCHFLFLNVVLFGCKLCIIQLFVIINYFVFLNNPT